MVQRASEHCFVACLGVRRERVAALFSWSVGGPAGARSGAAMSVLGMVLAGSGDLLLLIGNISHRLRGSQ